MKIAIFDYRIMRNNAVGACHLRMLERVCSEHEFTVFAVDFENPCPERITWVRIPAPRRPLALLYIAFHVLAPLYYAAHHIFHRTRFDLVQFVESNLLFGDVAYAHSCHHMFLQRHWRQAGATGWRGALRWLDHWLHSLLEPHAYRTARRIVVPSRGFAQEFAETYPFTSDKIQVLANSVDTQAMRRPQSFDRDAFRRDLHLQADDIVLAFVAQGHYELKGLPLLLAALTEIPSPHLKLLVVGGSNGLASSYRRRVAGMGLDSRVTILGDQKDVRPYLWAADALVHPSRHEVFPLAPLEGAAAGLPLLVTRLNGVEEFFREGENGLLLKRDVPSLAACLTRFAQIPVGVRHAMGDCAQAAVQRYNSADFALQWSKFYAEVQAHV